MGERSEHDEVTFVVDGEPLPAYKGETVAAALLAAGRIALGTSLRYRKPRSLFCGIGVCFDCVVQVDGRANRRACQVFVSDGMKVETRDDPGRRP